MHKVLDSVLIMGFNYRSC
uniref:Uncharacterized protein n=1 Tax=Rhizophora mucronata TaxID=61149 RepID=A0A2P2IM19_RHIMU